MTKKETPLSKQYNQIKSKYPDSILLFRLGDFYETFNNDAILTAKVCGITLTKRNNGAAEETPLAGFPHHQLDNYLPKLIRAGHRVAVCEQLEDPKKAKGIVKRGVTELVTPGVALYDKLLEHSKNNYVASIFIINNKQINGLLGFSYCDISTGEFSTSEIRTSNLVNILESIVPSELLISKNQKTELENYFKKLSFNPSITYLEEWIFEESFCYDLLIKQFNTKNLKGFGIENYTAGISSAGTIMHYLKETQNKKLSHINTINIYKTDNYMSLDSATRRNLEITISIEGNSDGTLFSILDRTNTSMGARLLKSWVTRPLNKLQDINERLDVVESFYKSSVILENLRNKLSKISDLERLCMKLSTLRINPRELRAIFDSLNAIKEIQDILSEFDNSKMIKDFIYKLNYDKEIALLIDNAIKDEPGINIGSGNIFKESYNNELDNYVDAKYSGKNLILEYQKKERELSGISSLKVSFNNVFGYFIEVSKINKNKVPNHYERKQTLTNSERYTSQELKEIEEKILNAEDKILEFENLLYQNLLKDLERYIPTLLNISKIIASIDVLQGFAKCSQENNYIKPEINDSDSLHIEEGRHPVVESLLPQGEVFIANDTDLNNQELIHIITGPNMSGKSCYLRQVAIIVLLGQIGCYVPAKNARFGIVDRIFTRVGSQDNIKQGESTFLVEMQEAANIVNNATNKSLILLDEVGRGTATFDGISIAWALTEYINEKIRAKTLFATHYHELNELADKYQSIVNYRVDVIERKDKVIFTHKVLRGKADHSFGIQVAKMAGMPLEVVNRSNELMRLLESNSKQEVIDNEVKLKSISSSGFTNNLMEVDNQLAIFTFEDDNLRKKLKEINIENITPIQAFKILSELINDL